MEAVASISKRMDYVTAALRSENEGMEQEMAQQNQNLIAPMERLIPRGVYLDGETLVGERLPGMDAGLHSRLLHFARRNVR